MKTGSASGGDGLSAGVAQPVAKSAAPTEPARRFQLARRLAHRREHSRRGVRRKGATLTGDAMAGAANPVGGALRILVCSAIGTDRDSPPLSPKRALARIAANGS